jgi:hypothetical protein
MAYVSFPSSIELDKPFDWRATGFEELIKVKVCVGSVIDEDTVFIFNGNRATYGNLATIHYDQEFFNKESDDGPRTPFTTTGTYTLQFFSREYGGFENSYDLLVDTKTINVSEPVLEIVYPTSVRQRLTFSWKVLGGKPGESFNVAATGPINFTTSTLYIENNRIYSNDLSYYEYAGTYNLTFNFSRSGTFSRTVVVEPKIYITYPESAYANKAFTYSITGGNPEETWSAQITGPVSWTVTGVLDAAGTATYTNAVFSTVGAYNIVWTFPSSGLITKQINIISDGRDGIHPAGSPLYFSEINAEFLIGYDLDQYRDYRWYLQNGDYGNFDVDSLDFSEFFNKKAIDPAVPGSQYYYIPGHTTFAIPLHRNQVTIEVWGGGGGSGTSARGADSIVSFPGNYMIAGGGTGSGGGERRYFSPGGAGGQASGGQENINGNVGGNDMGAYWKGGTGANAPNGGAGGAGGIQRGVGNFNGDNGQSPGGGGGGRTGMDGSSYPGYGGAGGGGSGAYCATTTNLPTGTIIDVTVGQGAQDTYAAGGDGAVKISWY